MTISDEVFEADAAHHARPDERHDERHDAVHEVPDEPLRPASARPASAGPAPSVLGKLLRIGEVAERLRMGKSTILRFVREGKFPRPLKNPSGANVWTESVILDVERLMHEPDVKEAKK